MTLNVSSIVVAPSTLRVPCISVLPLSVSTLKIVAADPVCTENNLLSALTVRASVTVVNASTSNVPLTVKLSSMIVSPVLESKVREPEVVSISDEAATPILMLSAVISVDVIAPLNVEVVLTARVSVVVNPVTVAPPEVVVNF